MRELVEAIESLENTLEVTNKLLQNQHEIMAVIMFILIRSSSDEIVHKAMEQATKFLKENKE